MRPSRKRASRNLARVSCVENISALALFRAFSGKYLVVTEQGTRHAATRRHNAHRAHASRSTRCLMSCRSTILRIMCAKRKTHGEMEYSGRCHMQGTRSRFLPLKLDGCVSGHRRTIDATPHLRIRCRRSIFFPRLGTRRLPLRTRWRCASGGSTSTTADSEGRMSDCAEIFRGCMRGL